MAAVLTHPAVAAAGNGDSDGPVDHEAPVSPEGVLRYWCGGDPATNAKHKWFASVGSLQQTRMDAEVTEQYSDLLAKAERGELEQWHNSPRTLAALIIVLDQFSRHIHRSHRSRVDENDKRALALAQKLVAAGWLQSLEPEVYVFALMPLRHTPTIDRLRCVMDLVDRRLEQEAARCDVLQRFRRATQRRLYDLEAQNADPEDILEFHPFDADETRIHREQLFKTVHQFLIDFDAHQYAFLMTSLSGGVDSMVLTYILHKLRAQFGNFDIVACHVDYGNRPESHAEAEFVKRWCAKHNIRIFVRSISDIKRGVTPRDEYEKISRDIRYDLYKKAMSDMADEVASANGPGQGKCCTPGVMVGHHQGDIQENVISNVMKGRGLLQLTGMAPESTVNGVSVWRPLLPHLKRDVFDFSHKYGIPYFKDTTPKWSNRGKLRNQLLPLLEEIYGEGFLGHISALSEDSDNLAVMAHEQIFEPVYSSLVCTAGSISWDCKPHAHQPLFFWKTLFTHVCHRILGIGLIPERPIRQLLKVLASPEAAKGRHSWVFLRKGYHAYLDGWQFILFRPGFFPTEPCFKEKQPITLPTCRLGSWIIEATPAERPKDTRLLSIGDVASGDFTVYLPAGCQYVVSCRNRAKELRQVQVKCTDAIPCVNVDTSSNEGDEEDSWLAFRHRFQPT
eukprot:m.373159 g.373159  ORF g.373159 m.373159 type:complete len:676 (+) comp19996_c0_seq23:256-2283(+)